MSGRARTNYEIVEYQPTFKDQVLRLESTLWGSDPAANASYFEWKYERNPQADGPILYVALSEGRVVGVRGFSGSRWQAGTDGQVFSALLANDFVVSRDHRGRGLGTSLIEHAERDLAGKGHSFVFSFAAFDPCGRDAALVEGKHRLINLDVWIAKNRHTVTQLEPFK